MNNPIPWWQNGVIYQIYPKSFQDSTGNGYGDLAGVTQRLDYLQKLGVDAIWLTPVYVSPQVDNGYDVADYCAIDPAYGTLDDFKHLVTQAHLRGIRIVMDMVFNHTSTEHAWFKASQDPSSPYRQFYIWRDGEGDNLPNNWRSKFGGNAWQWHADSGQYYLHLFATEQADLNWEHQPVRDELKKVCEFWADIGVDGLRLDVINLVSKQQDFPNDYEGDGRRFYTDGPRIHEFLQEMSRDVFQPRGLMTVGEMSSTRLEHCQRYAALGGDELSMTFNFHHLKVDYLNGEKWSLMPPDRIELKQIFNQWQQGMHNRAWNALFWCNHDQPRIVSRFGDEGALRLPSAKMLAMVLHGMQGTPYIYQGEEIGMTNPNFTSINQYRDVESLNMYRELSAEGRDSDELLAILAAKSRDNGRTPMQWDHTLHAGFTQGTPWIEPCSHYTRANNSDIRTDHRDEINVVAALADPDSVFYAYQYLIALRKQHHVFTLGDYRDLCPQHPDLWCYLRSWQGQQLLVVANLSDKPQAWEPEGVELDGHWQLLMSSYGESAFQPQKLVLRAYEGVFWIRGED